MKKQETLSFDEVFEIVDLGEQDTYDFVIPETRCFIANGILVHNSGDIRNQADNIIFLYAPDASPTVYMVECFLGKGKDQEGFSEWLEFNGSYQEFREGEKPIIEKPSRQSWQE